jgi:GntR family transcriptional repressor for pyruvate dehydrogenase complex
LIYGDQKLSVAGETVARIADMIRSGRYAPGARLPSERKLAEQLQVSRTSVREALSRLETFGLLESRHGLGTFVKDPSREVLQASLMPHLIADPETVGKLFELREIIEIDAAARAAERATTDQKAIMRRWVEEVETQMARENAAGVVTADVEFHRQIIIATGNDILVDLMDSIVDLLRAMRRDSLNIPELRDKIVAGHRSILTAIEAGDSDAAREAMRAHLAVVSARVKAFWAEQQS